ncbi:unnamed protein product, partial [Ectocarpus fasciculatus]
LVFIFSPGLLLGRTIVYSTCRKSPSTTLSAPPPPVLHDVRYRSIAVCHHHHCFSFPLRPISIQLPQRVARACTPTSRAPSLPTKEYLPIKFPRRPLFLL